MPTTKQLKGAAELLLGAKPKPVAKFPKMKTAPIHDVEDEVLTWDKMEMDKVRAEPKLTDADLADMQEYTGFADVMDQANEAFQNAKQVYVSPTVPQSVHDAAPLRAAAGPAFPSFLHYSDSAIENYASMAMDSGRSAQYATHMTDTDAAAISQAFLKKNDMNVGNSESFIDDMRGYEYDRGFANLPMLQAHIDKNGDTIITGIDRTKGDDGRGWNTAMLLSGRTTDLAAPKHLPLVLNYDKPLFENSGKITGKVFFTNSDGELQQLTGINVRSDIKVPDKYNVADPTWMDAPLEGTADANKRVGLLFSDEATNRGAALRGSTMDFQKTKKVIWPSSNDPAPPQARAIAMESKASYFPDDAEGNSFYDQWVPEASEARAEIHSYTKDSPYKASLVDPDAPKGAPMLFFRGSQGNQFVDEAGKLQTLKVMDPRNAREFGAHVGSMQQASYFALKGIIPNANMKVIKDAGREFKDAQMQGRRILDQVVNNDPTKKALWDSFVEELKVRTGTGQTKKAEGFDDDARVIVRPSPTALLSAMHEVLVEPAYKTLREGFSKHMAGTATALNKVMPAIMKGNADLSVFVTNAKKPLFLWDTGSFGSRAIANQLLARPEFTKYYKDLQEVLNYSDDMMFSDQGFSNIANHMLRDIIEKQGYDHIAYINTHEAAGSPSFIFWKKDSLRPLTDFGVGDDTLKLLSAPVLAILAARAAMDKPKEEPKDGA